MKEKLISLLDTNLNIYSIEELETIGDLLESYRDQVFAILVWKKIQRDSK
jgi:hypothetical protein